jgi:hypothetical protein
MYHVTFSPSQNPTDIEKIKPVVNTDLYKRVRI